LAFRAAALQDSFRGSIDAWPDAHEVNAYPCGQGLGHEARALAALVLTDASDDVHRPAEVVLSTVDRAIEVQKVATVHATR
jgi:hypothetical protein